MVCAGVNENQTLAVSPPQGGSSAAVVPASVLSLVLNGSVEIAVAWSKSSFGGGRAPYTFNVSVCGELPGPPGPVNIR
jgi:hypothetical protein